MLVIPVALVLLLRRTAAGGAHRAWAGPAAFFATAALLAVSWRPLLLPEASGSLWRKPDQAMLRFLATPSFEPGATYRVLRVPDFKVGPYQLLRAGGRLDSEFFPESIVRRRWPSATEYGEFLRRRDVDYVMIWGGYARVFKVNEADRLAELESCHRARPSAPAWSSKNAAGPSGRSPARNGTSVRSRRPAVPGTNTCVPQERRLPRPNLALARFGVPGEHPLFFMERRCPTPSGTAGDGRCQLRGGRVRVWRRPSITCSASESAMSLWMGRQTWRAQRSSLTREGARREVGEDRLAVQRAGVDLARHPDRVLLPQRLLERGAVDALVEDGQVLVVVRLAAFGGQHRRDAGDGRQRLVVEAGDAAADGDELVEAGQLHDADGGVELAHPPGVAEADVVAAEEAGLALVAVDAGLVAQALVGGGDRCRPRRW